MVISRTCRADKQDGTSCGAAPLQDGDFCYMHSPEHAEEMQEARRLGGLHRRRESTLVAVYDIGALDTVPGIRRILEIALIQGLGIENSVGRSRMLIAGAMALAKLLQFGEHEDRLQAIEQVLHSELKGRRR